MTTHYFGEAEQLCRNIAIINAGESVENTSIKSLLKTLNQETFILDLDASLPEGWSIPEFNVSVSKDGGTVEVEVVKGQSINAIFKALDAISVNVVSMRNKSNRLEELFVKLIKG